MTVIFVTILVMTVLTALNHLEKIPSGTFLRDNLSLINCGLGILALVTTMFTGVTLYYREDEMVVYDDDGEHEMR